MLQYALRFSLPWDVQYDYLDCSLGYTPFLSHCASIQIRKIENVSHLSELSVLNLAGNSISRVENLQGLDSLTELNLRHNCISLVVSETLLQ